MPDTNEDVRTILAAATELHDLWWEADAETAWPASGIPSVGGHGREPADPTRQRATAGRSTGRRDHIAAVIAKHADEISVTLDRLRPASRRPSKPCACCRRDLATHDRLCVRCDQYRKRMRRPCGDDVHEGRHYPRWCACPPECCPAGCPDQAAEERFVSERCRKRMYRARQAS